MPDKRTEPNIQNTYRSSFSDLVMSVGALGLVAALILLPGLR